MNIIPKLVPRQERLIKCLLMRPFSRYELGDKIGSLNVPDVVHRLRQKGLNIITERKPFTTRDGDTSFPGIYRLPMDEIDKALEWIGAPARTPSVSQDKLDKLSDKFNSNIKQQGGLHG